MAYTVKVQLAGGEVVATEEVIVMVEGCGLDGDEQVQLVFCGDGVFVSRVDGKGEVTATRPCEPESLLEG
jgi:hypothetical protein